MSASHHREPSSLRRRVLAARVRARVVVVDDDPLFVDTVAIMLGLDGRIEVVGVAYDGAAAVERCRRELPDVALMDLHMPRLDGIAATRAIRRVSPATRVLVLTSDDAGEAAAAAEEAGAARVLVKTMSIDEVRDAVVEVAARRPVGCVA